MTTILDDRSGAQLEVLELIAEASGRAGRKSRWTEIRLWAAGEGYAVELVGRSLVRGERDRRTAWLCPDADAVRKTLRSGPLSRLLLERAGLF